MDTEDFDGEFEEKEDQFDELAIHEATRGAMVAVLIYKMDASKLSISNVFNHWDIRRYVNTFFPYANIHVDIAPNWVQPPEEFF